MFRQRRFASLLTKNVNDRVMTVELNHRPVNLLTRPLLNEFADTFKNVEVGGDVGAIVLTSGTPGIFTAGLDIMEIYQRTDESIIDYWTQLQEMWISLYSCPVPVICAINGTCPAAGCLMACSTDYRIMIDHPKFQIGLNETQLGFAAPNWLCWLYQDIIGKRQGELHLQLGSLFGAQEAHKLGLVDKVVKDEIELAKEVQNFAEKILRKGIKCRVNNIKDIFRKIDTFRVVDNIQRSVNFQGIDRFHQCNTCYKFPIKRVPNKPVALTKQLLRAPHLEYLHANRIEDAKRFTAQVQAEQTQKDIGHFLAAMKK